MRNIQYCMACGLPRKLHCHHLARRENDSELVIQVCAPDHGRYFTPWHETSGVIPGINPSMASIIGFAQHQTLKFQRHGYPEVAEVWRKADHRVSSEHGRKQLKWARPRRVGGVTKVDSNVLKLIAQTNRQAATLFNRILSYPGLPESIAMALMTSVEYYETIAEDPQRWIDYVEPRAHLPNFDDQTFVLPEMYHFLHYIHKRERVAV